MKKRPPSDAKNDLIARIRHHLETLKLPHILAKLDEYLAWATHESPSPSLLLDHVLGEEATLRRAQRIERRIALSGLKERKTLEAFDWLFQPSLDKGLIIELAGLQFVQRAEDLIITGKSGTGKSHLLMAFALRACEQQLAVRYARCVDMLDDLYAGLGDGTYLERLKKWCAPAFLVIDDVGLGQVKKREGEPTAAHMLFNLLDRRHTHASTAMTSNIKLSAWGQYLGDATLAAAVLDRLAMRAIRVDIDGPSYRQQTAKDRARARGSKLPEDSPE
jgi:DNA replication protein DnaC